MTSILQIDPATQAGNEEAPEQKPPAQTPRWLIAAVVALGLLGVYGIFSQRA